MCDVPYGGIIGIGNSNLDIPFRRLKIFRLHAALHDAFGYCKTKYNEGPGYSYIINIPWNSCLIGHVTGLFYCLYLYFCRHNLEV
jgi:hypothetical protein